jgi:Spy/CpxP family protein refolding chaperone
MIIACLIGLVAAVGARAADEPAAKPTESPRPMRGNMMDSLLPPHVLDDIALTADQKTQYGALEASFKKDAAKWRADNNYDPEKAREEMRTARDSNDQATLKKLADQRKGLADIRKGYVNKLRGSLTDEQKTKLDKALANGPRRGPRGGPNSDAKPATPPTSPPSDK